MDDGRRALWGQWQTGHADLDGGGQPDGLHNWIQLILITMVSFN